MLCVNDYKDRFNKTYSKIKETGLLHKIGSIFVVCVGDEKKEGAEYFAHYDKVNTYINDDSTSELSTLTMLWEFCTKNDSRVLYLHSKGVTRLNNDNVNSWVSYMEYFCIDRHEECLDILNKYDTCGVSFADTPMKHYSGNFWWSKSSYIRTRNKYNEMQSSNIRDRRCYCEFWLMDVDEVNYASMHQSNCDLYSINYTRERYANN